MVLPVAKVRTRVLGPAARKSATMLPVASSPATLLAAERLPVSRVPAAMRRSGPGLRALAPMTDLMWQKSAASACAQQAYDHHRFRSLLRLRSLLRQVHRLGVQEALQHGYSEQRAKPPDSAALADEVQVRLHTGYLRRPTAQQHSLQRPRRLKSAMWPRPWGRPFPCSATWPRPWGIAFPCPLGRRG